MCLSVSAGVDGGYRQTTGDRNGETARCDVVQQRQRRLRRPAAHYAWLSLPPHRRMWRVTTDLRRLKTRHKTFRR